MKQFSPSTDQLVHKSIDYFEVVPKRSFGTDVEKSFQFPERINEAPKNLSASIIESLHEPAPACSFAWFLHAVQIDTEANFENGVQRASH